jgi:hypothetical protein
MKELLHHFGFFDNRVQVGLCEIGLSKHNHGVVFGLNRRNNRREYIYFVTDQPHKLKSPSNGMVADMAKQFARLGVDAEVIELQPDGMTFTYQVSSDNSVQRVSMSTRYS